MRADQKTYNSYMAFNDPDKSDSLHEKGVAYLCQEEKINKIISLFDLTHNGKPFFKLSDPVVQVRLGYHSHQTTREIKGYADLNIFLCRDHDNKAYVSEQILIEVKSHRVSAGAIIQQLSTYRHYLTEHGADLKMVVATLYQVSKEEKNLLENQSIKHIFLDPDKVQEWSKQGQLAVQEHF